MIHVTVSRGPTHREELKNLCVASCEVCGIRSLKMGVLEHCAPRKFCACISTCISFLAR